MGDENAAPAAPGASLRLLKARMAAGREQQRAGGAAGATRGAGGPSAAAVAAPLPAEAAGRSSFGSVVLWPSADCEGASLDAAGCELSLARPRSSVRRTHRFFSGAVPAGSPFGDAYERFVDPAVERALSEGESVFVTAAGAKGSGKSTALRGAGGVMERIADAAWAGAAVACEVGGYASFRCAVSCVADAITAPVESHVTGKKYAHEVLYDALARRAARAEGATHVGHLTQRLREHPRFGFFLDGLSWVEAGSLAELRALVRQAAIACEEEDREAAEQREAERGKPAASKRAGAAPQAMHFLLRIRAQLEHADGTVVHMECSVADLQGVARPQPPAKGLTEAQRKAAIAARPAEDPVSAGLSRCLDAASERRSHVPLRDSKLTRLFKPMLVGSARAIVVLAADLSEFEETDAACVGAHRYAKLVAKDGLRACLASAWNFRAEEAIAAERARELADALGYAPGTADAQSAVDVELDMQSDDVLVAYRDALAERDAARTDAGHWDASVEAGAAVRQALLS